MQLKLKNQIKRMIREGTVKCIMKYKHANTENHFSFFSNKWNLEIEAKRWIKIDYEKRLGDNDLQKLKKWRSENLKSVVKNGRFQSDGHVILLYQLDYDNLLEMGFSCDVIDIAESLKNQVDCTQVADINDCIAVVDKIIDESADDSDFVKQNKHDIVIALSILCSKYHYQTDLK